MPYGIAPPSEIPKDLFGGLRPKASSTLLPRHNRKIALASGFKVWPWRAAVEHTVKYEERVE